MEITKVEKTGVTRITESIRIKYTIPSLGGDVDQVSAMIHKDENIVGYFNAGRNGVLGFSLQEHNGLSTDEVRQSFEAAINDIAELFGTQQDAAPDEGDSESTGNQE
jgi:hypothetical protein